MRQALAKDPAAADPGKSPIRYRAASSPRSPAPAKAGKNKRLMRKTRLTGEPRPSNGSRPTWVTGAAAESGTADSLATIRQTLEHWKTDANRAGIRDERDHSACLKPNERPSGNSGMT